MAKSKSSYFDKRNLTPAIQAAKLKSAFPDSKVTFSRDGGLSWMGHLHPTPLSVKYKVRIDYGPQQLPEVTIIDPPLVSRNGSRLPHVFKGNHPACFVLSMVNGTGGC